MVGGFVAGDGAGGEGWGCMKNKSTERKECYAWPRGQSGKLPCFKLTDEEEAQIITLVGKKGLESVNTIVNNYLINRQYYEEVSVNELNKKLFEAGEHAAALDELLQNNVFLAYLQNKVQETFSEKYAARLADNPYSSNASSSMLTHLRLIKYSSQEVKERQSNTGRRSGTRKVAEKKLIERLHSYCTKTTRKLPTNNPKGLLQQLIAILNRPLDLGGTLPGIVRQVVDERILESQSRV